MIKFVIIDKDEYWQKLVKKIVMKFAFNLENVRVEIYNSLDKNLENTIKDNSYHNVFILDVELANLISGVEIAKMIRKADHDSHIIFLTNHDNFFEEVHRNIYEIYTFIEKFHDAEEKLSQAIKSIVDIQFDNGVFHYETRGFNLQIFYKEILYIERDTVERKVIIHTKQSTFAVILSIEKILTLLDGRFKQVHRSCIVNNDEVMLYNWSKGEIILKNGQVLPLLSKKYRPKPKDLI